MCEKVKCFGNIKYYLFMYIIIYIYNFFLCTGPTLYSFYMVYLTYAQKIQPNGVYFHDQIFISINKPKNSD